MNRKILLSLLAIPTAVGVTVIPFLIAAAAAQASESSDLAIQNVTSQISCDAPPSSNLHTSAFKQRRSILVASSGNVSGDDFATDFSEAESDVAVQLFGCDCPACIRSLRQLQQNKSLSQQVLDGGGSSQGHCLASLQKRMSPQAVKDVLKTLEVEKAP
jgi:hypothetical protein